MVTRCVRVKKWIQSIWRKRIGGVNVVEVVEGTGIVVGQRLTGLPVSRKKSSSTRVAIEVTKRVRSWKSRRSRRVMFIKASSGQTMEPSGTTGGGRRETSNGGSHCQDVGYIFPHEEERRMSAEPCR